METRMDSYLKSYAASMDDPIEFWREEAGHLDWFEPYNSIASPDQERRHAWFIGGQVNACHEALDRHVIDGRGDEIALIYESGLRSASEQLTFSQLRDTVAELAGYIAQRGVGIGDSVLIYMPAIPQAVVAMLACARVGAIHAVVFGGFGPRELSARISLARPKLILTASCGLEPGRVVPYMPLVEEALALADHDVPQVIVWQRPECAATLRDGRDEEWQTVVPGSTPAPCFAVPAEHPLYVLYTSGTTGQPKGVVRDTAGYLVALHYSMRAIYGVSQGSVFWAASDIGWVVGHSYMVYGPLVLGCATVMYEGKPVGTPDAGVYWRLIERHRVNVLFSAPTAIRAIMRDDPEARYLKATELPSLHAVFLAGERSDPVTVRWLEDRLSRPVIDHWWQTESGWPITAICLGLSPTSPVKHGSAGLPVPGYNVCVLDGEGEPLPAGIMGTIALKLPLPPGCLISLWDDQEGYHRAYLEQYPGYYSTGDGGFVDPDGYVHVMGRIDDIINVAGHRLSTGELEQVISSHPAVAECAVIAIPDTLKGQVPLALATLKSGVSQSPAEASREVIALVRHDVGAVASLRKCLIVDGLPKTRSGKILRGTMRQIAANEPWSVPPTIEDPGMLEYIGRVLEEASSS